MTKRTKILAAILKEKGIAVQSIEEGDDGMDHELNITEKVSVQVSSQEEPYVIVSAWLDDETMQQWRTRKMGEFDLIVADIHDAITKAIGSA